MRQDFFALRIWKGYREAECAWVSLASDNTSPNTSNNTSINTPQNGRDHRHDQRHERSRDADGQGQGAAGRGGEGGEGAAAGGVLCLLLYAPRRKMLEAWHIASGKRIGYAHPLVQGFNTEP
ncbi:Rab3 GTPase-activating protein regulatory subunit N-terminus-domain-containing protein [Baffinella frigidus]|nr:Rab3 GTPase-activating protein regulatory subunit N-terminus-domain-containing protein [Cryptophyta sp. CCMP2293]